MYLKPIIAATAVVFATSAFAQGVSHKTPGYQMQHPKKGTSTGPGASEYTPSHSTTTGSNTRR
jgi:hypothetical protein